MMRCVRGILAGHALLLLSACAVSPSIDETAADPPPNIILIMADDLGYGDLSCYGGAIPTPHLDALAAGGLRCLDFHSNGAVCSPTRAALMTGRYQHRAGIQGVVTAARHRDTGMSPDEITVAEMLGRRGHATALFGKWHLGYEPRFGPNVQGFDEFRGFVSGNVDYFSHIDQTGRIDWWRDDVLAAEEGYATELVTDHAIDFMRRERDRPFLLYIAHGAPHYPYQGPNDAAYRMVGNANPTGGPRRDRADAYGEMIQSLDESVGRIAAELDALDLTRRTLVVFCSDNGPTGPGSAGPWQGRKGSLWEGGHRVPAIFSWPGVIEPGESSELMMTMDLAPTFAHLAGAVIDPARRPDGVDLIEHLSMNAGLPQRDVVWTHGNQRALRRGIWKLVEIRRDDEPTRRMLFRLDIDPAETTDVAADHPQLVQELRERLETMIHDLTKDVNRRT